jgi:hypothetical protein
MSGNIIGIIDVQDTKRKNSFPKQDKGPSILLSEKNSSNSHESHFPLKSNIETSTADEYHILLKKI